LFAEFATLQEQVSLDTRLAALESARDYLPLQETTA
jgi:hypothetical protein